MFQEFQGQVLLYVWPGRQNSIWLRTVTLADNQATHMRSRVPECNRDGLAAREVVVVGVVGGAPADIEVEVRFSAVSAVSAQSKKRSLDHVFIFSYPRTVPCQMEVSRDGTIRVPHPDPIFMTPFMIVVGIALHDSYDPSISCGIHARAHGHAKIDRVSLREPMPRGVGNCERLTDLIRQHIRRGTL